MNEEITHPVGNQSVVNKNDGLSVIQYLVHGGKNFTSRA